MGIGERPWAPPANARRRGRCEQDGARVQQLDYLVLVVVTDEGDAAERALTNTGQDEVSTVGEVVALGLMVVKTKTMHARSG